MLLVLGFSEHVAINWFWKIPVVEKRTLKCLRTDWTDCRCSGSTAAAVWCWLTAEKTGLVAADVLAVWQWLGKRQLVGSGVENGCSVSICWNLITD